MVSGLGVTLSMEWQPAQFARAKIIPRWAWGDCAEAACTRHNDAATAVRASQRAPVLRRWPAPSGQKTLDKRRMLVVVGICKRASLAILFSPAPSARDHHFLIKPAEQPLIAQPLRRH